MRRLLLIAVAASAVAGCGNDRTPPPETAAPLRPAGEARYDLRAAGISFTAPNNWDELRPDRSLVGGVRSRTATLAIWRYPRAEPLPDNPAELAAARDRLVERIESQDPSFELDRVTAGGRAVTVLGTQTMGGQTVRVRSRHVFRHGAEVVIDAYSRPQDFDRVDAAVFRPLLETLRITAP